MEETLSKIQEIEVNPIVKKNNKTKRIVLIVLALILTNVLTFCLTSWGVIKMPNRIVLHTNNQVVADALTKINSLEKVIQSNYYQDVDDTALMDGALKGMFSAIGDEYSKYYTVEEFTKMLEQSGGSFEGIGILVTEDESETAVVVTPYKDTPAGNAGMQAGDRIIKVDGEDLTGKGMDYAVSKMRGKKGTEVTVTVRRDEGELSFTMIRDTISTTSVDGKVLDNGIGYIEISEFIETTGKDFNAKMDELESAGINGLIIDLRFNGGGLVDQAVEVADRLMDEGMVVYTVDKQGNREDYKSTDDRHFDKPVVVLVNDCSASASEILAGALQDRGKAKLVGIQSFGKGIVQTVQELTDGSGFQITTATYYTPNGRNIHGTGLTPDVIQEQTAGHEYVLDVPQNQDLQLQKAIEIIQ